MNVSKSRPCHRHHFRRSVQFHRAGSQWNHTVTQREILGLKQMNVPEQLMLGMVPIEEDNVSWNRSMGLFRGKFLK